MRRAFYNATNAASEVVFDGTDLVDCYEPALLRKWFEQSINRALTVLPSFAVQIQTYASSSDAEVSMDIIPCGDFPDNDEDIFVCICEDSLESWFGVHRRVVRALYQFPLTVAVNDTFDTTIAFTHDMQVSRMSAVVFVQNMLTQEIYQATSERFSDHPEKCIVGH